MATGNTSNPAGRLHTLLTGLREQPAKESVRSGWSQVLGLPPKIKLAEFTRSMAMVLALPAEIQDGILVLDDVNHELLLRHMDEITKAVASSVSRMHVPLENVLKLYGDTALLSLEMCSDVLGRKVVEPQVSGEDLEAIARCINEAVAEVQNAEIDGELKTFLLSHLLAMLQAVGEVRIRGAVALREELDRITGSFGRRRDLFGRLTKNEPTWSVFASVLSIVASAVQVTALMLPPAPEASAPHQNTHTGTRIITGRIIEPPEVIQTVQ